MENNVEGKIKTKIKTWKFVLVGVILIFLGFSIGYSIMISNKLEVINEANRPPKFELTYIVDNECEQCFDITLFGDMLKEADPLSVVESKSVQYNSKEGEKLIKEHGLTKIPALVAEGDINKNEEIKTVLTEIGEITEDVFVFSNVRPPFINLENNDIVGEFEIIYLKDESCTECYDVTLHRNALENLQLQPSEEKIVDYGSEQGKKLVEDYNIETIPTIILTGELSEFIGFNDLWKQVGTIEEDGTYIFRSIETMGKYKDLITNTIKGEFK